MYRVVCPAFFIAYSNCHGVTLSESAKKLGGKAIAKLCAYKPYDANDWNRVAGDTADIQLFYQENLDERNREFAGLSAATIEEQTAIRMPANLIRSYRDQQYKQDLWEAIFNIDKICPKRLRYLQVEPVGTTKHTQFANVMETDSVMTSVKFVKRWDRKPTGLNPAARVIGIDPGQRSFITSCDTDTNLHLEEERSNHVYRLPIVYTSRAVCSVGQPRWN
ncbi:uncharacterized protein BYT42DRAFT_542647 [Radiomyces spectabilis]|uniref:uncharacterized protein n=1 Tax=Radiomyces spectabilis TaxID=64574 RepID=UPI0022207E85|nr:uncharacterized protein BYT42DRAFT_542647 [Radiomyces spectabilis]KAI8391019.1 hypothetical protein BYT42DRAFT_542647 [Radiomyces spectabilis]